MASSIIHDSGYFLIPLESIFSYRYEVATPPLREVALHTFTPAENNRAGFDKRDVPKSQE
jgi:hypothetical protein